MSENMCCYILFNLKFLSNLLSVDGYQVHNPGNIFCDFSMYMYFSMYTIYVLEQK